MTNQPVEPAQTDTTAQPTLAQTPTRIVWWLVFACGVLASVASSCICLAQRFASVGPALRALMTASESSPQVQSSYVQYVLPHGEVWSLVFALLLLPVFAVGLKLRVFGGAVSRLLIYVIATLALWGPACILVFNSSRLLSPFVLAIAAAVSASCGYLWVLAVARRRFAEKSLRGKLFWHDVSYWSAVTLIWFFVMLAVVPPGSLAHQLAIWLGDAWNQAHPLHPGLSQYPPPAPHYPHGGFAPPAAFDFNNPTYLWSVKAVVAFLLVAYLARPVARLAWFASRVLKKFSLSPQLSKVNEAYLWTLKQEAYRFPFRHRRPFLRNATHATIWMLFSYLLLFVAVLVGPFDYIGMHDQPKLRLFLAAMMAMWGTVPLAVGACVWLPLQKPRQVIATEDGFLVDGALPYSMFGKPFRSWQDVKSIRVSKSLAKGRTELRLTFHSGGWLTFINTQMETKDLHRFLTILDERADNCTFDDSVAELQNQTAQKQLSITDGVHVESADATKYKSTIFAPLVSGQMVPGKPLRIVRQLASKPLSAVYVARDDRQRLRIVKQFVLPVESEQNTRMRDLFKRECELLQKLNHPSVCKVVEVFDQGNACFLVLEHSPGEDLLKLIALHGPQSEKVVVNWAKQLCSIMSYLHAQNVVHRDLTPDNIVIDEDNSLRLIDFGAAHQFLEGVTGTLIGKQCYVAPEQLRGKACPASDIYSFGGTLYFLLTGKEPRALSSASPLEHVNVSAALDGLIRECTDFDFKKRPQSFDVIAHRLASLEQAPTISPVEDEGVTINIARQKLVTGEGKE
ncbi:MAG: serine/threonine-protein kinase [Candidatus Obscuribacterales bacterium]